MHPDEALANILDRVDTLARLRGELIDLAKADADADLICSCLASIQYNAAALQGMAQELSADLAIGAP
jgi:hypothetical protein